MIGIPIWVTLPGAYITHVCLVYKRSYHKAEKVLLGISAILVVGYISSLAMGGMKPLSPFYFSLKDSFLFLVAANVGAVVMPFMLFYQASATAERGLTNVKRSMVGTLVGAVVSGDLDDSDRDEQARILRYFQTSCPVLNSLRD